jgi:hypothetical protein
MPCRHLQSQIVRHLQSTTKKPQKRKIAQISPHAPCPRAEFNNFTSKHKNINKTNKHLGVVLGWGSAGGGFWTYFTNRSARMQLPLETG